MRLVIVYLIFCLILLGLVASLTVQGGLPVWLQDFSVVLNSALMGSLGGVVYCLRSVYLNRSVRGQWDSNWETWYYIRPLVSFLVGGVSYIFLKAGLLILDAANHETSNSFGFLSLAFIAGLNVDKFLKKIEEVAQTTWGVEQSRAASQKIENGSDK